MGKGDKRRPQQVSDDEMASNWDRIFSTEATAEEGEYEEWLAEYVCPHCGEDVQRLGDDSIDYCSADCGCVEGEAITRQQYQDGELILKRTV